jgi:hypothetical protein
MVDRCCLRVEEGLTRASRDIMIIHENLYNNYILPAVISTNIILALLLHGSSLSNQSITNADILVK